METAGWVKRQSDPADRRVYRIALTPAGRRLWQKVAPAYDAVVGQVCARLGEVEMAATVELLATLREDATRWELPKRR
jgi:DNA-binding MarR family transcriptional regulator